LRFSTAEPDDSPVNRRPGLLDRVDRCILQALQEDGGSRT
jgi:hypothetical protein